MGWFTIKITKEMPIEIKKLRQRFVSDYNLPIQVLHSPYFEERLEMFERDFDAKTKYDNLLKLINENYDGKPQKFLEDYANIRESIISHVKNSDGFQKFLAINIDQYKTTFSVGNKNLYTETNAEENNNFFITFDLKKANYQAIKWFAPTALLNSETYEDFISNFTNLDYFKESKYIRQVVFGQLNPKRTISLEKYLIGIVYDFLSEHFKTWGQPFSINSDEIIYKLDGVSFSAFSSNDIEHLTETIKNELGLDIRINKFKLHLHQFLLKTSEAKINIYEKESLSPYVKSSWACLPITYAPQIYKLLSYQEPTENDRTFYYEHELVTFKNPLSINQEQEKKVNNNKFDDLPF